MSSSGGSKMLRFGTLTLLYFVQGAMKLLFLPWVCKPLYAPLIERTKSKLWWLLASMVVLGITCISAALTSEDMLGVLAVVLFLLNLASATQDICVDSLALKILRPEELGAGNTIQVVAYKAGSTFAGGSLLWLRDLTSWSVMWLVFSSLYFICICLVWSLGLVKSEKTAEQREVWKPNQSLKLIKESIVSIFNMKGTTWMVCFVLFYKLCERAGGTLPIYLVDKEVPLPKLAFWTGFVRSAVYLSGSSLCGFLLSARNVSPRTILLASAKLRCFPIFLQFLLISFWGTDPIASADSLYGFSRDNVMFYSAVISLCLANFCAGMLTTACFTAMMTLSQSAPEKMQSSHYSLLATMEVFGKLVFASISGWMMDICGIDFVFMVFVALSFLTVPLLWSMPDMDTDKQQIQLKRI